jgi:HK97 family phage prohead protease
METTSFKLQIKSMDEAGKFSGLASTFGNLDLQNDIVDQGAFTKSLMESNSGFPLLWQHDLRNPIGVVTAKETARGLEVTGELALEVQKATEAYSLLRKGIVKGLSIGFDVVKQAFKDGVRHLQEIKLYEVSLVTLAANPLAQVVTVKSEDADIEPQIRQFQALLAECRKSWA